MPAPPAILEAAPVTLLTMELAGRTWRVSSRPVDVPDGDVTHLYRGGLAPVDVYQQADLTGVSDVQSQGIEMLIDADLAAFAAQHHLTSEATAEVAWIVEGADWGSREVSLSGSVTAIKDGRKGEPFRIVVTADDPATKPSFTPGSTQQISEDTWTADGRGFGDGTEGEGYQQVYGQAGLITVQGGPADVPAVPAHVVFVPPTHLVWNPPAVPDFEAQQPDPTAWLTYGQYLLIAGDWIWPKFAPSIVAYGVRVWDSEGNNEFAALFFAKDALGRVVALCGKDNGTGSGNPTLWTAIGFDTGTGTFLGPQEGQTYYITFADGGFYNSTWDGPMLGAGSIIEHVLEHSAVRVDWRRTRPALAQLDRYELAGYSDATVDRWSWLVDNVFPHLPASWIAGPQGVYPVVWRQDATRYNADARLIDGINCTIRGPLKHKGEPVSRHVLDYGNAIIRNNFRRRAVWHGGDTLETTRESSSLPLRQAALRYGERETVLSADLIYSDRMADKRLAWASRMRSQPETHITVVGDGLHHRSILGQLRPGMAVSVTSERYSFDHRIAYVLRSGWRGGIAYSDLIFLSSP